uniref:Integrase, catalytic region, zinc finger, CCHC-type, peptidase aspartic, catalytic n=1 Tax=Tanacetum cinerariifolium TaxID=118510 RepID=A0A6L2MEV9_TANCI|nr:hypothetical protein [Tanacetum cinerariifolium]
MVKNLTASTSNSDLVNQVDASVQNFKNHFVKEAAKFVRDFKSLPKEAGESLDKIMVLEKENEHLLRTVVTQDIMSIVPSPSVVETSELQTELERMFRINPTMNSRVDNFVPNKHVKASVMTKPITVSQLYVITKKDVNSNNHKHTSFVCNNIKLVNRNEKSEVICTTCKQCLITTNHDECVLKYVNGMNSNKKNQSVNASESVNQTKHMAHVNKSKRLGSEERLASPKPSKPRTCHRWLPTRRIFDLSEIRTESSNTESESDTSVCDNASTSNPQEPTRKGFPDSTSFLDGFMRLRWRNTCLYPLVVL